MMMPESEAGNFNEAMMDLGSEICKPKNPNCEVCPLNKDCLAFQSGKVQNFPVKSKKTKATDLELTYYFVEFENQFLIKQRKDDFIWKKLYEFPIEIPKAVSYTHLDVYKRQPLYIEVLISCMNASTTF